MKGIMNGRLLAEKLAEHLRWSGWVAFDEMPLGSTTKHEHMQRADVVALRKSYNLRVVAYEIKMSRSDFFNDVRTGKYSGYFRIAHQVVFVVPSGLVKKVEVPQECGLMIWNGDRGSWHSVKGARVHDPSGSIEEINEFLLACLFRGFEDAPRIRRLRERIIVDDNVELSRRAKNLGWEIARRITSNEPELRQISEAKAIIDEFLGYETGSLFEAASRLKTRIQKDVPGVEYLDPAAELVNIARDLVHHGSGSLFGASASKRLMSIVDAINAKEGNEVEVS